MELKTSNLYVIKSGTRIYENNLKNNWLMSKIARFWENCNVFKKSIDMVRIRQTEIVPTYKIMSREEIREFEFREADFISNNRDSKTMIEHMAIFGLIQNTMVCPICLTSMSIVKSYMKQSIKKLVCVKPCEKTIPLTHKSFSDNINVKFNNILPALYKYIKGKEYGNIAKEIGHDRKTVGRFFELLREVIAQHLSLEERPIGSVFNRGIKSNV